jgi:hypothetical protein
MIPAAGFMQGICGSDSNEPADKEISPFSNLAAKLAVAKGKERSKTPRKAERELSKSLGRSRFEQER